MYDRPTNETSCVSSSVSRLSIRTELLAYLERSSNRVQGIAAVFTLFSGEYFCQTSSTPEDLRDALAADSGDTLATILDRAVTRGEIDGDKLIPPIATLLSDLFQRHAITTFSAPPLALQVAWVDSIFLPLVRLDEPTERPQWGIRRRRARSCSCSITASRLP